MRQLIPHWERLVAGERIELVFHLHPEALGFKRLAIAEPNGQVQDWAMSLSDGSRLHLWYMPDGRWIMHRDAVDPDRGPLHAAVHVATATRVGKALLLGAAVFGLGSLLARGARA
jgi:hypothetical protein